MDLVDWNISNCITNKEVFQRNIINDLSLHENSMQINEKQFTNPSFLQKLALDLIKPRKSKYPEDCINYYLQDNKFVLEDIPDLRNKYNHLLKVTLIKHRISLFEKIQGDFAQNKTKSHSQQKCIIYLHGLGSNRMQGFSILPHLPKNYSLLTFDLSGSGKSQGQFTSYGFRQQQDIEAVLNYLIKTKNFKNFIIWGRSMGAVSSLLFNNKLNEKQNENENSQNQHILKQKDQKYIALKKLSQYIKCIIADSPFCSFQNISKDIALNKMSVPHFFTDIALKFIQSTFEKILLDKKVGKNFTPFQIDFTKNKLQPVVPIVFVYSLNDEIVPCQHSEKIIKSIEKSNQKMVQKIIIPQCSHNSKRPDIVIETIFQKIQKFCNIRNEKNIFDQSKNINSKESYFQTQSNKFQKQTKILRRKSFWDFQQQFSQTKKYDPNQFNKNSFGNQKVQKKNNVFQEKIIHQKATVRRNIFQRKQSSNILNTESSIVKKRGLSLSSTIQRMQSTYKQNNYMRKTSIQPHKAAEQKSQTKKVNKLRQMSLDVKNQNKNQNQQNRNLSNKKFNDKYSRDFLQSHVSKTIEDSRCSHSKNKSKTRIYLGGSIEGKRLNSSQLINMQNKNSKRLGNKQGFLDEMMEFKKSDKDLYFSTVSQFNKIYNSQSFNQEIPSKDSSICIENPNFQSEPNILPNHTQQERSSSRQYLRTIELGGMKGEVDTNLAAFINNKLQFQFDNFDVVNRVFSRTKTTDNNSLNRQISKQREMVVENQQQFLHQLRGNKDTGTNINVPSHSSFRPSIRLYNEKRKKKVQAQHALFNKIQQNIQITNQRYLIED